MPPSPRASSARGAHSPGRPASSGALPATRSRARGAGGGRGGRVGAAERSSMTRTSAVAGASTPAVPTPGTGRDPSARAEERRHLLHEVGPQALVIEVEDERVDDGAPDDARDHRDPYPCPRRGDAT